MKIAMDTDTIVAALHSPTGASAEILRCARRGDLLLAASVSLFMEYEAVCLRPEHAQAAGLDTRQIGVFLDGLAQLVEPVEVHFLWRPQLRDPADELVLVSSASAKKTVSASISSSVSPWLKSWQCSRPRSISPSDAPVPTCPRSTN
jgi:predicted nucleic acid-binding protein